MKKRKLSFILSNTKIECLKEEVNKLEKLHKISVVKKPEMGLVMVKIKDGVYNENFYIGEVLITECSVHLDGILGMGIVQGDNSERAYLMGVIDAAFNCDKVLKDSLLEKIEMWEKNIKDKFQEEKALVEGSKVKFNVMGE